MWSRGEDAVTLAVSQADRWMAAPETGPHPVAGRGLQRIENRDCALPLAVSGQPGWSMQGCLAR